MLSFTFVSMNKQHSNFLLMSIWVAHTSKILSQINWVWSPIQLILLSGCQTKVPSRHPASQSSCQDTQVLLTFSFTWNEQKQRHWWRTLEPTNKSQRTALDVPHAEGGKKSWLLFAASDHFAGRTEQALTPLSLTHKVKSIANYNNARGGGHAGKFN